MKGSSGLDGRHKPIGRRRAILLWLLLVPLGVAQGASGPLSPLSFVTEEYPPYNYQDPRTGQLKGTSVALLEAMFEQTDTPFNQEAILYYPWVRGYELAQGAPNTVLFSTTRTPAREAHFKWVGPIARDRVVLLAWQDETATPLSLDAAIRQRLRVAVIREDIGAHALQEAGYPAELLRPAIDNHSALHMLRRGRVDLWAYSDDVARWIATQEAVDHERLKAVHTLSQSRLYFAVNPATDPRLVERLQQALDDVRAQQTAPEATHHDD
ncbi:ABC transporter substrate-binding protein [Halomonas sp. CUBES01]|uniref:ABC transporter substrate-binding protein n=1 Tax=Vreelandella gomseomensis TaxID=370766 RepID=A0ABU1G9F4_9GAMM|nr:MULTISPECIES: ABC transporter substrate-binding protein [Halomonas]MDR5873668.1 ABC transporter substrate-binding protein [Halomonas gomseomensis]MEC4768421.1 ABC transporter substrate-binding protein [Halomonas sp. CUBES01]